MCNISAFESLGFLKLHERMRRKEKKQSYAFVCVLVFYLHLFSSHFWYTLLRSFPCTENLDLYSSMENRMYAIKCLHQCIYRLAGEQTLSLHFFFNFVGREKERKREVKRKLQNLKEIHIFHFGVVIIMHSRNAFTENHSVSIVTPDTHRVFFSSYSYFGYLLLRGGKQ